MAVEDRTEQQLLTELATLQARVAQFEAREQALGASEPYRQIRLDGAVEHVRAEATAMRDSSDIGKVMAALYDGWRDSGLVFEAGCINIVDAEQRRYHTYALLPAAIMAAPVEGRILVEQDVTPGLNLYRSLDIDLDFARERGWAQPDLAASVWEAPATFPDDLAALWGHRVPDAERFIGCAGINVPFAYGGVFAQAPAGHQYSDDDVVIVERFADAVALGYTRFLDLQAAETHAAEQTRAAAIERVRATVMSMRSTDDLRHVVALLWKEMVRLGIGAPACNIVFLDEQADRVLEYIAFENPRLAGIKCTSPHVTEYDDQTCIYCLDTTVERYLIEGLFPFSFALGSAGAVLRSWQDLGVWSAALTEEMLDTMWPGLGLTAKPAWAQGDWVGTAVAFRYGKVGYNEQHDVPGHSELVRDLTQAVELGYVRFLDFQRLEEQNRQILETTRHKSEFLSRMSHDLRTPMNAIIGYTRILRRRARGALDDRMFGNLENIQTSADNLLGLINEILDLSRIEAGRVEIHAEPVDLQGLVEDCVASVAPLARPGVDLVQELPSLPPVQTDPERVRRIAMNLLGNALKFTEAGRVTVSLHADDDDIELRVADTGVGIPASDLPHVFEEFHQVERPVGAKREGTGLGLAIAQRSAQMLGGEICADSEVGKGSTFTLHLRGCTAVGGSC